MRERLIELLQEASAEAGKHIRETTKKVLAEKGSFNSREDIDRRNIYEVEADHLLANGVIVPPCKVGDWLWYIFRNELNKAKVEEIRYDASKHGYYSYSFTAYAYDFKNKREISYHPTNETQKNKSNIDGVEGMDFGEEVLIFLTKESAENALKARERV